MCVYTGMDIYGCMQVSVFFETTTICIHTCISTHIPAQKPLNKYPQQEKSKKIPKRKYLHTSVCVHKYPQQGNSKKIPNQNPKP